MRQPALDRLKQHLEMLDDLVGEFADGRTKTVSGRRKRKFLRQALDGIEQSWKELSRSTK